MFVAVDKHQRFKSFISQTTSLRLELSSTNPEKSHVSNFKIAEYFIKLHVIRCFHLVMALDGQQAQHGIV